MRRRQERKRARRELVAALGPELGALFEREAPELVELMVDAIADGVYTPEQGVEALRVCNEIGRAAERGEITEAQGVELVTLDALRQAGKRRAD